MRHRAVALLGAAALTALGCPSAYERTYERETQRLEAEQQARETQARAAHAAASRYAAVVYFPVGSAVIDADGERELKWFVTQMQPYPQAIILVQGFADTTGSEARNQSLSEDRARAVAASLTAQGISPDRINPQAFGTASPAASNATPKGRRNNRRVEVTVQ